MQMRKPDLIMAKENNKMNNNVNKSKLRKGLWSPEEDEKLIRYMITKGQGCWSDIARNAGLQRCGKSCRLRWINYLRPDLKRGAFSPQEEELIIHFHSILGNRYNILFSFSLQHFILGWTVDHLTSPHRSFKLKLHP
ncbi:transcription factor MYB 46-like protein [Trifolium pratense]|uniref:Transcription factor MYB 46-like protein n=1 Tax=Trifolium pratense TaxID=57577 RepID=A0A2K3KFY9_TRIPR|nr:transcription factor MYB 46-like protein [Trifolium pratense]